MISNQTIERIWRCQREINVAKAMLDEMEKLSASKKSDGSAQRIKDAFGYEQNLRLGIPCGKDSHQLVDVSPILAVSIIKAHIAFKEAELIESNESAKIELDMKPAC